MLNNRTHTEKFDAFLMRMDVPIKSYKLTDGHNSRYWRGLQVTWYLATLLSNEEQRQYIGNTMAAIYFKEDDDEPFEPSQIQNMGSLGVIHIVVTPVVQISENSENAKSVKYRVGFLYRDTLGEFGPCLPKDFLFDGISIRDFILTKVYNGYVAAMTHPPLDRMFQKPRATTIKQTAKNFLPKNWPKSQNGGVELQNRKGKLF